VQFKPPGKNINTKIFLLDLLHTNIEETSFSRLKNPEKPYNLNRLKTIKNFNAIPGLNNLRND